MGKLTDLPSRVNERRGAAQKGKERKRTFEEEELIRHALPRSVSERRGAAQRRQGKEEEGMEREKERIKSDLEV